MKKILSFLLCLCAVMAVQAQVIKKGDAFWNGKVLYTVTEIRQGKIVYMQGIDASGNYYEQVKYIRFAPFSMIFINAKLYKQ